MVPRGWHSRSVRSKDKGQSPANQSGVRPRISRCEAILGMRLMRTIIEMSSPYAGRLTLRCRLFSMSLAFITNPTGRCVRNSGRIGLAQEIDEGGDRAGGPPLVAAPDGDDFL